MSLLHRSSRLMVLTPAALVLSACAWLNAAAPDAADAEPGVSLADATAQPASAASVAGRSARAGSATARPASGAALASASARASLGRQTASPGSADATATAAAPAGSAAAAPGRAASVPRRPASRPVAEARAPEAPASAASAADRGRNGETSSPPLRAFESVVKDATREPGLLNLWRKDERTWIEVLPEQWGQPFFFASGVTHGIGESELFGNRHGPYRPARDVYVASLRRFGSQGVHLVAHNHENTAAPDSAARFLVERSFSESLLATAAVVSQPHPDTQAVLVDASALLLGDFAGGAGELERTFRQSYAFDSRNSSLTTIRNTPDETGFRLKAHYTLARPSGGPGSSGSLPASVPDARSLFLGFHYSFARLSEAMQPRLADPRVGYFVTPVSDFSDPLQRQPTARRIARWRLEKADPEAPVSEPRQPITYWLDRNIPVSYRDAVRAGILEWNKAFERAGFRNAIVVRQQGDDEDVDLSSLRAASVRWVLSRGLSFAGRAPSKRDPRSGEILDADVEISDRVTRLYAGRVADDLPKPVASRTAHTHSTGETDHCDYADAKLGDAAFAMDLLVQRGELVPGSPQAEKFIQDYVKDLVMHEVGHTLGLRHNFRGSTAVTAEQLRDPAWTARNGISGSVMDYNGANMALEGERQADHWMGTLGPYDYWAIEYGYTPFAAADEADGLARILARSGQPGLAYATDEDVYAPDAVDPEVNQFDQTNDPLAYYRKRFALVQEMWVRLQRREMRPGESYAVLRRNFERGFNILSQSATLATRYVGGVTVRRDSAGTGRAPLQPVAAERQREALDLLRQRLFDVGAFRFPQPFLASLAPDWDERAESPGTNSNRADITVGQRVFEIQRDVLGRLLREGVAARLVGAAEQAPASAPALSLAQLYGTLQTAIWRDLAGREAIDPMRRNLQREHVRLLAEAVAKPNTGMPADARSLQREFGQQLLRQLRAAVARRPGGTGMLETRAHLNESITLIDAALRAQIARSIG